MALMSEGNRVLFPTNVERPWLQQLWFNEFPASKFPGMKQITSNLKIFPRSVSENIEILGKRN